MSKIQTDGRTLVTGKDGRVKERFKRWAGPILVLFHSVGLAGLTIPITRPLFLALTPYHIIGVSLLLFWFDSNRGSRLALYLLGAALLGFAAEVIGVSQGWLFGSYAYGTSLGIDILGVPILIGLNWAMLGYCASSLVMMTGLPIWQKAALAALLLAGFDACMEPAAIGLGFWHWPACSVPGQNYLGWWLTGLPVCFLRLKLLKEPNPLAFWVWWCQFAFFYLLSWWVFPSL